MTGAARRSRSLLSLSFSFCKALLIAERAASFASSFSAIFPGYLKVCLLSYVIMNRRGNIQGTAGNQEELH